MKRHLNLALGMVAAVCIAWAATPAQATPDWDTLCFGVVSQNSLETGLYVCTSVPNGWGVYTIRNYQGSGTAPFIQREGTNWVLESGAGSPSDANIGTGDEPQGSASTKIRRYCVEAVVCGRPGGAIGATRDPIDTVSGAMFTDETDLVLPAAGFDLAWRRTYNSMNAAVDGPLGPGWSHNYNWRVAETTLVVVVMGYTNSHAGMVLKAGGDNAVSLIRDGTNRTWNTTRGAIRTVTGTNDGYALNLPEGVLCRFDTNGLVTSLANQWGNRLAFAYTNVPGGLQLAVVAHSDGRALRFAYTSNRLMRVDSPSTNLYTLYAYNTAGELTNAVRRTTAGAFSTAYAYDTAGSTRHHCLVTRVNAKGESATYLYQTNAAGEATSVCVGMSMISNYYEHAVAFATTGSVTTVTYSRDATSPAYTYGYDGAADNRCVTQIVGAENTGIVQRFDHDARTLALTNEHWETRARHEAVVFGNPGTNYPLFVSAHGLAIDAQHRLYVCDQFRNCIYRYDPSDGAWIKWGQWGTAVGSFYSPSGVAVDAQGNVYVADSSNYRVQKRVATNGQWISWGSYGTNTTQFNTCFDVAVDSRGNLYVSDAYNKRVQRMTSSGVWSVHLTITNFPSSTRVNDLFVDSADNLYVSDEQNGSMGRIQKFDTNGVLICEIGNSASGGLSRPFGMALVNDAIFVADSGNSTLFSTPTDSFAGWRTVAGASVLQGVSDVAWDPVGVLYVADTENSRILALSAIPGVVAGTNGQGSLSWFDEQADILTVRRLYDSGLLLTNTWVGYNTTTQYAWSFGWNTNWDMLSSVTDPEGHKVEWGYTNGSVNVAKRYPATNQSVETRYAYTSNGLLVAVTNANGHWIRFSPNAYGYPTSAIPQAGPTNSMTWDILGNLKEILLPGTHSTNNEPSEVVPRVITLDPDELGRLRKITWPDGRSESFAFDGIGNVTNHVDTTGRTNRFSWLPTRKLASTTRFLTGTSNQTVTVGMTYDQQMNVLKVNDELGRAVETYQLDLQDRPITVTNVESQKMAVAYGLGSMVSQFVRFDGSCVSFGYDEGARLNKAQYPDATLAFRYMKNGLLLTASNSVGTISNVFDGANRLILTQGAGPTPQSSAVTYHLDAIGNPTNSQVTGLGYEIRRVFDAGERLSSLAAGSVGAAFSYGNINGLLKTVSYTNGMVCYYGYDDLDRLSSMTWRNASNQVLRSRAYGYSAAGMITNAIYESGERVDYTYDSLDRLTGEKHAAGYGQVLSEDRYEYDLTGNRTKKTVLDSDTNALITVNYALSTGNRLASWSVAETNLLGRVDMAGFASEPVGTNDRFGYLWVSNAVSGAVKPQVAGTNFWAYDLTVGLGTQKLVAAIRDMAGNMGYATNTILLTVVTNGTYQHNAAGCVTNIAYRGKDYSQPLGLTWDGQYQLTAAATNGAAVERYGHDAYGRRVWTWDAANGTNWHVYDGPHVITDLNPTGRVVRTYVWGPGIDNLLAMTIYGGTTNTYYAIRDHLNSVLALMDSSGAIVEQYRYDAWGRATVFDASGNPLAASAVGNRYCWQGREYSWKTGLYYFRARWYDPVAGRWLSNDPIGISGGLNQYAFCANNPMNFTDPSGLILRLLGSAQSQASILKTMGQFIRGTLAIDGQGYVSRKGCSEDEDYDRMIDRIISSANFYDIALVDKIPFFASGQGAFAPDGWSGGTAYVERNQTESYGTGFLAMGKPEPFTHGTVLAHELVHAAQNIDHTPGANLQKPGLFGPDLESTAISKANQVYPRMGKPRRW